MPYLSLPPVPVVTPADYVAQRPVAATPPATRPAASAAPAHGPAVILGGALARPAERKSASEPAPPKPSAPPATGRHIDRII